MKVFISSIISGFEEYRSAAKEAIETFSYKPVMAEDFPSRTDSPKQACLSGVNQSDMVILILGGEYGPEQNQGLSATHEEYRQARDGKNVLAFVQSGIQPEPAQERFIKEVEDWEGGLYRASFRTAKDLRMAVSRALHLMALEEASGPVDEHEMIQRATRLLPDGSAGSSIRVPVLNLAIAGGPKKNILRPADLEARSLELELHQQALFGDCAFFDKSEGCQRRFDNSLLILEQPSGAAISLSEDGAVLLAIPIKEEYGGASDTIASSMPVLIEEAVGKTLEQGLSYVCWLLEYIDQTRRLSQITIMSSISAQNMIAWRTLGEHKANPQQVNLGMGVFSEQGKVVHTTQKRGSLHLNYPAVAEDLLVCLRREWKR